MKTLYNITASQVPDMEIIGNPDSFKLLSKVSSESIGWMKSVTAMDVGTGCLVQVTTRQRNKNDSYSVAEALTFVPDVFIVPDVNNGYKLEDKR